MSKAYESAACELENEIRIDIEPIANLMQTQSSMIRRPAFFSRASNMLVTTGQEIWKRCGRTPKFKNGGR